MILTKRERYIIRRKDDGKVFCGLAKNYQFKALEDIGETAIKTYRSKKQAEAAIKYSWGRRLPEVEFVKVIETMETEEKL